MIPEPRHGVSHDHLIRANVTATNALAEDMHYLLFHMRLIFGACALLLVIAGVADIRDGSWLGLALDVAGLVGFGFSVLSLNSRMKKYPR